MSREHHPDKRRIPIGPIYTGFYTRYDLTIIFLLSGWCSLATSDHVFYKMFFLTVFLERNSGITGVPFGRTDLSSGGIGTTFHALLHRHGPVGPSFQGMPEKLIFRDFVGLFVLNCFMKNANEHGWISALRAENNTK